MYLYPFDFQSIFLNKDVGLIPTYFQKIFDLEIDIIVFDDHGISEEINSFIKENNNISAKLFKRYIKGERKKSKKILFFIEQFNMILFVLKNAKKYKYLMMFHFSFISWFYITLATLINPKIKVLLKLDIDRENTTRISQKQNNLLKGIIYKKLIKKCDLISCETEASFKILKESPLFDSKKLTYFPNGIDKKIVDLYRTEEIIKSKENIILMVGRLGEYEKNTEMLLESVRNIDLKDWKLILIGPMTEDFVAYKEDFLRKNSEIAKNIVFTGAIFNRKELFNYFARSKCFVLTSRFESYGLVLNEAYSFLNYIISTDVGAAKDIVSIGNTGKIINQNIKDLTNSIIEFIENDEILMKNVTNSDRRQLEWQNIIINNNKIMDFFRGNKQ